MKQKPKQRNVEKVHLYLNWICDNEISSGNEAKDVIMKNVPVMGIFSNWNSQLQIMQFLVTNNAIS